MSMLAQYRSTQQTLAELQAALAKMEGDDQLKKELEFEDKLGSLVKEYGYSPAQVLAILDPSRRTSGNVDRRKGERQVSVYKNPNSGEIVEARGGNNRVLRAWKTQYGADTVKGWKQV